MRHVSRSIVIGSPVRNVYDQWTQFEEFPRFMRWPCSVRQIDSTRVMWCMRLWGKRVKWRTEIYEQVPDRYIAWRGPACRLQHGSVTFDVIDGDTTRVCVALAWQPRGLVGKIWATLGPVEWHVASVLRRFRSFIEPRAYATGGWRGRIRDGVVQARQPSWEVGR